MRAVPRWLFLATLLSAAAHAATPSSVDTLRQAFPAASIDTVPKADAALTATSGAKAQIDKEYKAAAQACLATVLVNDCIDRLRDQRRKRVADIDAIELEANRFKRRERSERIETDRAKREAERTAKAPADQKQREQNRQSFEERQAEAAKNAADRARSGKTRTEAATKGGKPPAKTPPPAGGEITAEQRTKNAAEYRKKVADAATHQQEIKRRITEKDAERKRRAEARSVKDAKAAAAADAAARAAGQSPLPSLSGPKP